MNCSGKGVGSRCDVLEKQRCRYYMQIYECINAGGMARHPVDAHALDQDGPQPPDDVAPSSPCGVDAPLTREQTMEAESFTDVQDEDDPEGYGFGV